MRVDDRRSQILEAAQAVFLERGLKAATVEGITVRAGVAKGTFYLYFDSREAVLAALRERVEADLLHAVEAALRRKNRAQALTDFVTAVIDFQASHAAVLVLGGEPPAEGDESTRAVPAALARFLAEGTRSGDFDVRNPQATAALLYGGLRYALRQGGNTEKVRQAAEDLYRAAGVRRHKKK